MNEGSKILVVGDSFAKGHGLSLEKNDPKLWVNQLLTTLFDSPQILNLSKSGVDNQWIFLESANAIIRENFDVVIIAWSELSRLTMNVGLELYETQTIFADKDININPNMIIKGKWLESIGDNIKKIYNDHWALLNLVKYINILTSLRNNKIYFVNSLFSIPQNYFERKTMLDNLSEFEKNIYNHGTRDDEEIKKIYDKVHDEYEYYGCIHNDKWLNLYESLYSLQIDYVSRIDNHPGYTSQDKFYQYLLPIFENKLNES